MRGGISSCVGCRVGMRGGNGKSSRVGCRTGMVKPLLSDRFPVPKKLKSAELPNRLVSPDRESSRLSNERVEKDRFSVKWLRVMIEESLMVFW
eukprot:scaffold40411_cov145-Amphora_coffeaeformis.AAC.2